MGWLVSVPGGACKEKSCTKVLRWVCCVFPDCSSCSQIDMGSVTWILSCDIALTLLVCFSLLCLVLYQRKRGNRDSNNGRPKQAPSLAKRKMAEIPESPYQELHGVQGDVYSNLEELRK
ncbi:TYRO protein tyrosine kinase-binding protein [Gadus chalcogrammus]|uniref:TYRO protein tyrosine kinase-binding protein n=1 Tax=Gadus chalcogrammus TaxID=1042646 RepID=UPI0024C33100|nr:TYRO protein tyrosine kinase-binding protein [Gadus chalcogrammus]